MTFDIPMQLHHEAHAVCHYGIQVGCQPWELDYKFHVVSTMLYFAMRPALYKRDVFKNRKSSCINYYNYGPNLQTVS